MFAYLTPNQHAKFAHIIAQCGRVDLAKELAEANAVWLIRDGSVDLTQIDNCDSLRYKIRRSENCIFIFGREVTFRCQWSVGMSSKVTRLALPEQWIC